MCTRVHARAHSHTHAHRAALLTLFHIAMRKCTGEPDVSCSGNTWQMGGRWIPGLQSETDCAPQIAARYSGVGQKAPYPGTVIVRATLGTACGVRRSFSWIYIIYLYIYVHLEQGQKIGWRPNCEGQHTARPSSPSCCCSIWKK